MTKLASTVPGAIESLLSHFDTVAANNKSMNPLVVFGEPVSDLGANTTLLMQVTGVADVEREWKTLGALGSAGGNPSATEKYSIECLVRAWTANAAKRYAQLQSLTNAWSIVDAIVVELFNDPTAGGAIGPPGSWSLGKVTTLQEVVKGGWTTDLTFEVLIENVRITWS